MDKYHLILNLKLTNKSISNEYLTELLKSRILELFKGSGHCAQKIKEECKVSFEESRTLNDGAKYYIEVPNKDFALSLKEKLKNHNTITDSCIINSIDIESKSDYGYKKSKKSIKDLKTYLKFSVVIISKLLTIDLID